MVTSLHGTMRKLNHNTKVVLVIAALTLFFASNLNAIDERIVNMRIEGPADQLFHTNVAVSESCVITDGTGATSTISGYKAICALQQAHTQGLITSYVVENQPLGYWLDAINGIEGQDDFSETWILRINNATANFGIADQEILEDDELLLTYGPWPSEPLDVVSSQKSVHVGKTLTLVALVYDDSAGAFVTSTDPTTFLVGGVSTSTEDGTLKLVPDTEGPLSVSIKQVGKTRSPKRTFTVLPELLPIPVTLRVEGPDSTITHQSLNLPETCAVTDTNNVVHTVEGYKAICVLQRALERGDISSLNVKDFGDPLGLFVDGIDGFITEDDFSKFWVLRNNFESAAVGISSLTLSSGDSLLLHFSDGAARPLSVAASSSTLVIGESIRLRAYEWIDDFNDPQNSGFVEYVSSTRFHVFDSSGVLDADISMPIGVTSWSPSATGTFTAYVTALDHVKSEPIKIIVTDVPPPRQVELRIEGPTTTLMNATVQTPHSCVVTDSTGTTTTVIGYKAICSLQDALKAGHIDSFTLDTDPEMGLWLNAINGIKTDKDFMTLWITRLNGPTAGSSIMEQVVSEGDEMLLSYGSWPHAPLDISFSTSTFASGTPLTLKSLYFDDFEKLYLPLQSTTSTFTLNNVPYATTGTLHITLDEDMIGSEVFVSADSYTRSKRYSLGVKEQEEPDNGGDTGGNGGGGGNSPPPGKGSPQGVSQANIQAAIDKLIVYIQSQQDETGKILDASTSDWSIMSFAAAGIDPATVSTGTGKSILEYATEYQFDDGELNLCAGHTRHALALLSAGIPATNALITSSTDYLISENCYADGQFGLPGINDDVFALFALLGAQATSSDAQIISDITQTIIDDQNVDGASTWAGFASPDITGAVLNVLSYAKEKGVQVAQNVLDSSRAYLKASQNVDGGWGADGVSDALNTSWAVMGITAIHEGQNDWFAGEKNPWHVLTSLVTDDGYYEASWNPGTVDWFSTKHAIPALAGKSWPIDPVTTQPDETPDPAPETPDNSGGSTSSGGSSTQSSNPSSNETGPPPPIADQSQAVDEPPVTETDIDDALLDEFATAEQSQPENEPTTSPETSPTAPSASTGTGSGSSSDQDSETVVDETVDELPAESEEELVSDELLDLLDESLQGQTLVADTGSSPVQKTARGVFGASVALAGSLSTLLAWRLLQTLI